MPTPSKGLIQKINKSQIIAKLMILHNTQRFFLSAKSVRVARAALEAHLHLRRVIYAVGFLTCISRQAVSGAFYDRYRSTKQEG